MLENTRQCPYTAYPTDCSPCTWGDGAVPVPSTKKLPTKDAMCPTLTVPLWYTLGHCLSPLILYRGSFIIRIYGAYTRVFLLGTILPLFNRPQKRGEYVLVCFLSIRFCGIGCFEFSLTIPGSLFSQMVVLKQNAALWLVRLCGEE